MQPRTKESRAADDHSKEETSGVQGSQGHKSSIQIFEEQSMENRIHWRSLQKALGNLAPHLLLFCPPSTRQPLNLLHLWESSSGGFLTLSWETPSCQAAGLRDWLKGITCILEEKVSFSTGLLHGSQDTSLRRLKAKSTHKDLQLLFPRNPSHSVFWALSFTTACWRCRLVDQPTPSWNLSEEGSRKPPQLAFLPKSEI